MIGANQQFVSLTEKNWQSIARKGTKFPGDYRLSGADEFSSVFSFKRVLRGRIFNLHYLPNNQAASRLGVIVAKKFAKKSTSRNFIKRVVREDFRRNVDFFGAFNIIIRLTADPSLFSRKALHEDLENLFIRLSALAPSHRKCLERASK